MNEKFKFKQYEIIYIDKEYIKILYDADKDAQGNSRVYYKDTKQYNFKPYIGMLSNDDTIYAVPLTSAKKHHATIPAISEKGIVISEIIDTRKKEPRPNWIMKPVSTDDKFFKTNSHISEEEKKYYQYHIKNFLDLEKMIPLAKNTYQRAIFKEEPEDTGQDKFRKYLLRFQYRELRSKKDAIEERISKIYTRQFEKNEIHHNEPDLKKLEQAKNIWDEWVNMQTNISFSEYIEKTYHTTNIKKAIKRKNRKEEVQNKLKTELQSNELFYIPNETENINSEKNSSEIEK